MGNGSPVGYDSTTMQRTRTVLIAPLAVALGVMAATSLAAPAQADATDSFLSALDSNGISDIDPGTAVEVGQSVCPMLSEPGQRMADVAGNVADTLGRPLGPATMFTGLAISAFCPSAVARLADGSSFSDFSGMLGGL
jgi:ABC-type transport system substrate-binding protein